MSNNKKYCVCISTDSGNKRKKNEDNFFINGKYRNAEKEKLNLKGLTNDTLVCAVFDGMGGEAFGDKASKIAAEEAKNLFKSIVGASPSEYDCLVLDFVRNANKTICEELHNTETKRSGSTLALVVVEEDVAYFWSIGDTRIYLCNGSETSQVTRDNTLAMKKYYLNIYTKDEAEKSKDAHVLTNFLGFALDNTIKCEKYEPIKLSQVDKILICSDGLYDMVDEQTINKILISNSKKKTIDLVDLANENGGIDNTTVLLIE